MTHCRVRTGVSSRSLYTKHADNKGFILLVLISLFMGACLLGSATAKAQHEQAIAEFVRFMEGVNNDYLLPNKLDPIQTTKENPLLMAVIIGHAMQKEMKRVEANPSENSRFVRLQNSASRFLGIAVRNAGYPTINGTEYDESEIWQVAQRSMRGGYDIAFRADLIITLPQVFEKTRIPRATVESSDESGDEDSFGSAFVSLLEAIERDYFKEREKSVATAVTSNPLRLAAMLGAGIRKQMTYVQKFPDKKEQVDSLLVDAKHYLRAVVKAADYPEVKGERVDEELILSVALGAIQGKYDDWLSRVIGVEIAQIPVVIKMSESQEDLNDRAWVALVSGESLPTPDQSEQKDLDLLRFIQSRDIPRPEDSVRIDILDVFTEPAEILSLEEFELHIDYVIADPNSKDDEIFFTLTYSILEGEILRLERSHQYKTVNGGRNTLVLKIVAGRTSGAYGIRTSLEYKDKLIERTTEIEVR